MLKVYYAFFFFFFLKCWHVERYKDNDCFPKDARRMIIQWTCDSRTTIVLTRFDCTIIARCLQDHHKTVLRSSYDNRTTLALWAKKSIWIVQPVYFQLIFAYNKSTILIVGTTRTSQSGKQPFSENRVQIGSSVRLEICSQANIIHTHRDKLQWKYNPSTISWKCKKVL